MCRSCCIAYYDEKTASDVWEKIHLQYAEFLKDEPALHGVKMTVIIYDPILNFAWYVNVPDKPPLEDVQQDVYDCFMNDFDVLGKIFDLNRRLDNRLANKAFFARKGSHRKREQGIPCVLPYGILRIRQSQRRHPLQLCPMSEC